MPSNKIGKIREWFIKEATLRLLKVNSVTNGFQQRILPWREIFGSFFKDGSLYFGPRLTQVHPKAPKVYKPYKTTLKTSQFGYKSEIVKLSFIL